MKKKHIIGLITTGLVAVIAIGTTLAYLTHETTEKLNDFVYSKSGEDAHAILAMLTEPGWDGEFGYSFDKDKQVVNTYYDENFTNTTKPADVKYGKDKAIDLLPGDTVSKDPRITNMGDVADIYTAMRVSFVYQNNTTKRLSDTDMAAVKKCLSINYAIGKSDSKWVAATSNATSTNELIFYYKDSLDKKTGSATTGGATVPLFTTVGMDLNSVGTDDVEALVNIAGGYTIRIDGFAIQSKNLITDNKTFPEWAESNAGSISFTALAN